MKLKWDKWFYGLMQAVIGGGAAAGSSYIGTLVGNQISKDIPVMNWQSLGFVLLSASATNLFFYLKQSPLPQEITGDTQSLDRQASNPMTRDQKDP
jgi:hypothetical protein